MDQHSKQTLDLTQKNCYYCGDTPAQIYKKGHFNGDYVYNGLDRVNNNKGYTIDNVVSCCGKCNMAKKKLSVKDFKSHISKIYHNFVEER